MLELEFREMHMLLEVLTLTKKEKVLHSRKNI